MLTIKEFYNTLYADQAQNKNYQSIASYIDGLKPTARKVIHTVLKNNINQWTKVEGLANRTAGETEYLGGASNISGVIVTISKGYATSNNVPMLDTNGNFGQRLDNSPGEPRYIKTRMLKNMREYFLKEDDANLIQQEFEGTNVEPKFFVPSIPFIVVNGSEGIGVGHAQNIVPRKLDEVIDYIQHKLDSKETRELIPYWEGFNGKILRGESKGKWVTEGVYSVEKRKIIITELPVGYTLLAYTKKLDDLEDKKIIKSYVDESDTKEDVFKIIVHVDTKFDLSHNNIITKLKLQSKHSENYTCMDENNTIRVFEDIHSLIDSYINIKLEYIQKRKEYIINDLNEKHNILLYKYRFIKAILDGKIMVNKQTKDNIIKQIENIGNIFTVNGGYEYLLNMPIYSLTIEKMKELGLKVNNIKLEINKVDKITPSNMWKSDLVKL